jgi:hypothetical protein
VSLTVEFQSSVAIPEKSNGFFHSSNDGAGLTWQEINERILAALAKRRLDARHHGPNASRGYRFSGEYGVP